MSTAPNIAADAFVKSLKNQRNVALDALAEREAELAQVKMELHLARVEIEKKNADPEPA